MDEVCTRLELSMNSTHALQHRCSYAEGRWFVTLLQCFFLYMNVSSKYEIYLHSPLICIEFYHTLCMKRKQESRPIIFVKLPMFTFHVFSLAPRKHDHCCAHIDIYSSIYLLKICSRFSTTPLPNMSWQAGMSHPRRVCFILFPSVLCFLVHYIIFTAQVAHHIHHVFQIAVGCAFLMSPPVPSTQHM